MPDILGSIFDSAGESSFTLAQFLLCSAASLLLGALAAAAFTYKARHSKGFAVALAILPLAVQVVIMLVNGNLGAGVAVAGAFSLVRFRSFQGSAKEICAVFVAMAVGLACGMGYVGAAALLAVLACAAMLLLEKLRFGEARREGKELRVTVPEGMDYEGAFGEAFAAFTDEAELLQVKTAAMGSLFKLKYRVVPKKGMDEKRFIDALRCLNGNLEISLGMPAQRDEL
ncbi:MAG TPA: DUF4956 domain-containing protein [Clostridia bacterium]|nr:DUF4956 domain-containing protein [Clostridia bacterium]